MHTLLGLHGNIPTFIRITDGKVHDVNMLDEIMPEAGAFYVMDRGYIDFERLFVFTLCSAFFVVRTKENVLQRRYSHPADKTTGVAIRCSRSSSNVVGRPYRTRSTFSSPTTLRSNFASVFMRIPYCVSIEDHNPPQIFRFIWIKAFLYSVVQAEELSRHDKRRGKNDLRNLSSALEDHIGRSLHHF